jgi:hypothetical protein
MCTWAREAAPIGVGSNELNSSSIVWPVSVTNISAIDSIDETGHLSWSGMKVEVHSIGRR